MCDSNKQFFFFSHITRQAQYEHPCAPHYIYQPEVRIPLPDLPPPPPRNTYYHPHNMLVPANPYLSQGKTLINNYYYCELLVKPTFF